MRRRRSEDSLQFACIGIESEKAENFACSMSAYPKSALILLSALGIRGSFSLQVTCVSFAWHSGARRFFFFFCSHVFFFIAVAAESGAETLRWKGIKRGLFFDWC